MGGEVHSAHARQLGGALEFLEREIGCLHGQHGEPHESLRMPGVRRRRRVVVRLRERKSESRRRPINHRRGERQRVDIDPLPVHAFEAQAQIDELLVEGVDDSFGANGVAGGGVFEPRAFRGTVALEQFQPVRGIPVGVRIDRAARATPGPRAVVAILWNVAHRLTPDLRCSFAIRPFSQRWTDPRWYRSFASCTNAASRSIRFLRRAMPDQYASDDQRVLVRCSPRGV